MAILPARPLPLAENVLSARRRKSLLLSALFAVFAAAFGVGAAWFGRQAWQERKVWRQGDRGRVLKIGGEVKTTSQLGIDFMYEYRLDVVYADASGMERSARVEFDTLWKPVNTEGPATVRYLPADAAHPVLSYAIDAGVARWGEPILMAALVVLFLFAAVSSPRVRARAQAALRAVAEDGEELLHPLLSIGRYQKTWTVKYETAPGVSATASGPDEPLVVVRDGRKHVLALRSMRTSAHVLIPADLAVFAFDAATREAIAQRLRGS